MLFTGHKSNCAWCNWYHRSIPKPCANPLKLSPHTLRLQEFPSWFLVNLCFLSWLISTWSMLLDVGGHYLVMCWCHDAIMPSSTCSFYPQYFCGRPLPPLSTFPLIRSLSAGRERASEDGFDGGNRPPSPYLYPRLIIGSLFLRWPYWAPKMFATQRCLVWQDCYMPVLKNFTTYPSDPTSTFWIATIVDAQQCHLGDTEPI